MEPQNRTTATEMRRGNSHPAPRPGSDFAARQEMLDALCLQLLPQARRQLAEGTRWDLSQFVADLTRAIQANDCRWGEEDVVELKRRLGDQLSPKVPSTSDCIRQRSSDGS
jgi:hypothetical protein